jgi:hypothetical protein
LSKCPGQFLEAGERLSYGFEKGGHQLAITRKGSRTMVCRLPAVERIDRLEEAIYWLLSAVTLTYLLLELMGHCGQDMRMTRSGKFSKWVLGVQRERVSFPSSC